MNSTIVHISNWDNWWKKDIFFIVKKLQKSVLIFVTRIQNTPWNWALIIEKLTIHTMEV
jgi:hypothetical protein